MLFGGSWVKFYVKVEAVQALTITYQNVSTGEFNIASFQ
jgi:hypothetical protein